MEPLEQILDRLRSAFPGAGVEWVANGSSSGQHSLAVGRDLAREVALFLRDDAGLRLDYCSNVTGVDWPARQEKVKVRRSVEGVEKEVEEVRATAGHLEVVYHLYSMALGHGPVVIRVRTSDRADGAWVPSLTPVWRSCELQEREVYDLFGVRFEGHPDLRRLLMWEGFADHPMRRDYVEPDDYEYEPTPHDRVLERAQARARGDGCGAGGGAA
jgi:NADH-quinone oxidoreductase subunit C